MTKENLLGVAFVCFAAAYPAMLVINSNVGSVIGLIGFGAFCASLAKPNLN